MEIVSTKVSWLAGAWEVWGVTRDKHGHELSRLFIRTKEHGEAMGFGDRLAAHDVDAWERIGLTHDK